MLEQEQRVQLESFTRSQALPNALVVRAQIVLLAAEDKQNTEIAEATRMSRQTVAKWRERFVCEPGAGRSVRRVPVGTAAEHRRRTDRGDDQQDATEQTRRGDTLELSRDGGNDRTVEVDSAVGVVSLRVAATPAGVLKAIH